MIPYFQPLNGKPPIVERVKECVFTFGTERQFLLTRDDDGFFVLGGRGSNTIRLHNDIAAALTRDAIKCWAAGHASFPDGNTAVQREADWVVHMNEHEVVNRRAHALADALEAPTP